MTAPDKISKQLDRMACEAIGASLDIIADGGELHPTAYFAKRGGDVEQVEFSDDSADSCLAAAHSYIYKLGDDADMYAIAYDGFVQDSASSKAQSAVIVEFGERGGKSAYSAAVAYKFDKGGELMTADPEPAGEGSLLLG